MTEWTKYFTATELSCRCCNEMKVMDSFLKRLVELREAWGKMMVVTSCCRCLKHNDSVGGKPKSFHLFGHPEITGISGTCAIDIHTGSLSGDQRLELASLAMQKGWSVGVAKSFLHFDRRADYQETGWPKPVLFTY